MWGLYLLGQPITTLLRPLCDLVIDWAVVHFKFAICHKLTRHVFLAIGSVFFFFKKKKHVLLKKKTFF